jgi:hypothetical protein
MNTSEVFQVSGVVRGVGVAQGAAGAVEVGQGEGVVPVDVDVAALVRGLRCSCSGSSAKGP